MLRIVNSFFCFTLLALIFVRGVCASDFSADYDFTYKKNGKTDAFAEIILSIHNNQSNKYVESYKLYFPPYIDIQDIVVKDEHGILAHTVNKDKQGQKVLSFSFLRPKTGNKKENIAFISYTHKRAFTSSGVASEITIPVIQDSLSRTYNLTLKLTDELVDTFALSKPHPTMISKSEIVWKSPGTKSVYVIFGSRQRYKLDLTYFLQNNRLTEKSMAIAFPPETLYQHIRIDSITPQPQKTYIDSDGNFMGEYIVPGKKTMKIDFLGYVETYIKPQNDMLTYTKHSFEKQKKFLLQPNYYWSIANAGKYINDLNTVDDIFRFTVSTLKYDFDRASKQSNKRLGAQNALLNPNSAICMEYTDVFIALCRKKGIYAREIQGYAHSTDASIRPLSLYTDVLHSWPEYYDVKKHIWIPVDPTWENTSGADYFSSLDLNHIAFAIHGLDPVQPFPAGLYKIQNTKDIIVEAVAEFPQEHKKLTMEADIPEDVIAGVQTILSVSVINKGNSFSKGNTVHIEDSNKIISANPVEIDLLAPFEERKIEIPVLYKKTDKIENTTVKVFINNIEYASGTTVVAPPKGQILSIVLSLVVAIPAVLVIGLILKKIAL